MNSLVSIIVPFYNAEKYIEKCLKSLIHQTYTNVEIILIDNMSTDESLSIVEKYSKEDARIILLREQRQGVSHARNKGLNSSKGEYIVFVDADDYLELNAIENELQIIKEKECDIVFFEYYNDEDRSNKSTQLLEYKTYIDNLINMISEMAGGNYFSSIWRGIYNSKTIKGNNVLFRDIKFGEDLIFNIECILKSNSINISEHAFYHYMDNEESALKKLQHNLQNTIDYFKNLGIIVQENNEEDLENIYLKELYVCSLRILNNTKRFSNFKQWINKIVLINIKTSDRLFKRINQKKCFRVFLLLWKRKLLNKMKSRG